MNETETCNSRTGTDDTPGVVRVTATAEVTGWDEHDYDLTEGLPRLAEIKIDNAYRGDLEATGSSRGQMVYRNDNHAEFTALERVSGRLGDRTGTFVVRTGGVFESGIVIYDWTIVPGSATGELVGLTGGGRMTWRHGESGDLSFTYTLQPGGN